MQGRRAPPPPPPKPKPKQLVNCSNEKWEDEDEKLAVLETKTIKDLDLRKKRASMSISSDGLDMFWRFRAVGAMLTDPSSLTPHGIAGLPFKTLPHNWIARVKTLANPKAISLRLWPWHPSQRLLIWGKPQRLTCRGDVRRLRYQRVSLGFTLSTLGRLKEVIHGYTVFVYTSSFRRVFYNVNNEHSRILQTFCVCMARL